MGGGDNPGTFIGGDGVSCDGRLSLGGGSCGSCGWSLLGRGTGACGVL